MAFFTKPLGTTETVPRGDSHLRLTEKRLLEVQRAYEVAEKQFNEAHKTLFSFVKANPDPRSVLLNGELYAKVGAMDADPIRKRLESNRACALAKRNELLQQRAELLKGLKLIR